MGYHDIARFGGWINCRLNRISFKGHGKTQKLDFLVLFSSRRATLHKGSRFVHEIYDISLELGVKSCSSHGGGGEQNFIPGPTVVSSHQTAAQSDPVCQNL